MQAAVVAFRSMLESAVRALPEPALSMEQALEDPTIREVVEELAKMNEDQRVFILRTIKTLAVAKS